MGTRVPVVVGFLRVWAMVARLVGGFPYCWSDNIPSPHQSSSDQLLDKPQFISTHKNQFVPVNGTPDDSSKQPPGRGSLRHTSRPVEGGETEEDGVTEERGETEESGILFPNLQSQQLLVLWSYFISVLWLLVFIVNVTSMQMMEKSKKLTVDNVEAALEAITTAVQFSGTVWLVGHLVLRHKNLRTLLTHLDTITTRDVARKWNINQAPLFIITVTLYVAIFVCYTNFWIFQFITEEASTMTIIYWATVCVYQNLTLVIKVPTILALYIINFLLANSIATIGTKLSEEGGLHTKNTSQRETGVKHNSWTSDDVTIEVPLITTVRSVSRRLCQLCQVQNLLNDYFSTPLLIFMKRIIIFIIYDGYVIISMIASGDQVYVTSAIAILSYVAELSLMSTSPEYVSNEVSLIPYL